MADAAQPDRDPADRRPSWRRGSRIEEALATLKLTSPIAAGLLAEMGMSVADYVMAGKLGSDHLAAAGLGVQMLFTFQLLPMGALGSVSALGAQAHGAGDPAQVSQVVRQGLRFALALAIPVMIIALGVPLLLRQSGHYDPVVIDQVVALAVYGLPSIPAVLIFTVLRNYVTVLSRPMVATVTALIALPLTILGNYITIYGHLGCPQIGVAGIGLTMSVVQWFQVLVIILYINRQPLLQGYRVFHDLFTHDARVFADLWRVGWPIAAGYAFESGMFMTSTVLIGEFGVATLAAHNAVLNLSSISFMIPYAISQAATVRVGYAIGAGVPDAARRAGYTGMVLGLLWMVGMASVLTLVPKLLLGFYMDVDAPANIDAVTVALTLLPIAALFQMVDGLQVTTIGALRGLKDTRVPMVMCGLGYWLAGLCSGILLAFTLGFAGPGLWWGLAVGLMVSATLLVLRWKQMADRHVANALLPALQPTAE
jgi:MATE family multidrug resistance protein